MRTKWECRVENLSTRISWQDLKDCCREYGAVTFAEAHTKEKNQGTVCFETERDMEKVMDKLNGSDLNGRNNGKKLSLTPAKAALSRSRSPSGGRSRSKSGS